MTLTLMTVNTVKDNGEEQSDDVVLADNYEDSGGDGEDD